MSVAIMTSKRQSDFEDRFYDFIQNALNRLENKIDGNTRLTEQVKAQAEKTNGRVTANEERLNTVEKETFGKVKPSDLPPIWRDPKVISIVFNVTLIILILVIGATKVDVSKLIP